MLFEKVSKERFAKDISLTYPLYENIKQCLEALVLPHRATHNSAGYDFYLPYGVVIKPHSKVVVPTGISWHPTDDNQVLKIYPRSSLGCKHNITLANTVGIIDADYCQSDNEGHILITLVNNGDCEISLFARSKFVQGIIENYISEPSYDNLFQLNQRNGGFGSTNTN